MASHTDVNWLLIDSNGLHYFRPGWASPLLENNA